ncbi:MAG: N-acetyltransferase [Bacillota bacterium]|nr:N-acetyltransferase [Bacillota bacterium]
MVEVKEVKNKSDLRKFIFFPLKLYKNSPYYVPDLISDEFYMLQKGKNPAFEHCDMKLFLAYKDGKVAGRIGAMINRTANEKFGNKRLRFTRIDFIDDYEVSAALFKAAEDYGREMGMTQIQGPIGFQDMDKQGMLVEGFDRMSIMLAIYNYPYYMTHLEKLGFKKEADWIEYFVNRPPDMAEKMERLSEMVLRRMNMKLVTLKKMSEADPYVAGFFELADRAYSPLYGTVPLTRKQFQQYYDKYIKMMDPRFVFFISDSENKMRALAMAMPSLSKALRRCKGRLLPFGWVDLLLSQKKGDTLDMCLVAIEPELQSSGLAAVLLIHMLKMGFKHGFKYAESGPVLEANEKVQSIYKPFPKEQHKRRRCYLKEIV